MESKPTQSIRCAIYTRKSTEEGLDQEFNSLDAQRESAEAYIKSMKHEGWICVPHRYDDGGYTGGNMERPALKRLLADVQAGQIDCIMVYKVDRLSRSLLDFAKLMEVLDRHKVSFVSVTQQFNTTNSMGRLTLNVLLSFAQFEREIISERTRDKMGAARRKGKWTGGPTPLGYEIAQGGRKLVINEAEAKQIRDTFAIYLACRSTVETLRKLDRKGYLTKRRDASGSKLRGGRPFSKYSLLHLLSNWLYAGKVKYRGEVYAGEHPAIVDEEVFAKVQTILAEKRAMRGDVSRKYPSALLTGLLRCVPCNCAMIHTHSIKNKRTRYRYYTCANSLNRGAVACPAKAMPAIKLETFVMEQLAKHLAGQEQLPRRYALLLDSHDPEEREWVVKRFVDGVEYDGRNDAVSIKVRQVEDTPLGQELAG